MSDLQIVLSFFQGIRREQSRWPPKHFRRTRHFNQQFTKRNVIINAIQSEFNLPRDCVPYKQDGLFSSIVLKRSK